MSVIGEALPLIVPFLTWRDRWRLAQVNREARSILRSAMYEKEAFLHIVKIYNCFIEIFELEFPGRWTHFYKEYLEICGPHPELVYVKTWIGALMTTEKMYARHLEYPPSLPVAGEVWEVLPDERLDDLVKQVQSLSGSLVIEGVRRWGGTPYLRFVKRYTYPKKRKFSIKPLLSLIDNDRYPHKYMQLGAIADRASLNFVSRHTPPSFLQTAVRLVYVPEEGMLTSIQQCRVPRVHKRVAQQPFVTRAVIGDQHFLDSHAFQSSRSPYYFLRWLTGMDDGPDSDPSLQNYGPALDQLKAQPNILSLDPAIFWDLQSSQTARLKAGKLENEWLQLLGDNDGNDPNLLSEDELPFYLPHWKYAMHQIEEYLAKVFRPFTLVEAQHLVDAYTARGLKLVQSGDPKLSVGAYLEISLSDSYAGPNDLCAINDSQQVVVVLYVGPNEAVLYMYKDWSL